MPTTAKKLRLVADPDKLNQCISKLRALFMEVTEKPKIKKNNGGNKEGDSRKKECKSSSITVVMRADFHCDACGSNVLNFIRTLDGVDSATIGSGQKITVVGKLEPEELRRFVEEKTHIKFELLSPSSNSAKPKNHGKRKNEVVKKSKSSNKVEEKELPVMTAVMKMNLHCEGCIQKIRRKITKAKGFKDMKIDRQKEVVTVIGAMDMNALAESLKKHMKKGVEISPPPKVPEKEKGDGGAVKSKKNGGNQTRPGNGDGKANASGTAESKGAPSNQQVPIPMMPQPSFNPNPGPNLMYPTPHPILNGAGFAADQLYYYNPYTLHSPQMFSDENPNSCTVM